MAQITGANFDASNLTELVIDGNSARIWSDTDATTSFPANFTDTDFTMAVQRIQPLTTAGAINDPTVNLQRGTIIFADGVTGFGANDSSLNGQAEGGTYTFDDVTFLCTNGAVNGFGSTGTGDIPVVTLTNSRFTGLDGSSWFVNMQAIDFANSTLANIVFERSVINISGVMDGFTFDGTVRSGTTNGNAYTVRRAQPAFVGATWLFHNNITYNGLGALADGTAEVYNGTAGRQSAGHAQFRGNPTGAEFFFHLNSNVEADNFFLQIPSDSTTLSGANNITNVEAYSWNPTFNDEAGGEVSVKLIGVPNYWIAPTAAMDFTVAPTTAGTDRPLRVTTGLYQGTGTPLWIELANNTATANNVAFTLPRVSDENGVLQVTQADRTLSAKCYTHIVPGSIVATRDDFVYSGGSTGTTDYVTTDARVFVEDPFTLLAGALVTQADAVDTTVSTLDELYRIIKAEWEDDDNDNLFPVEATFGRTIGLGDTDITFDVAASSAAFTGTTDITAVTINQAAATPVVAGEHFDAIFTTGDVVWPLNRPIQVGLTAAAISWDTTIPDTIINAGNNAVAGAITLPTGTYTIQSGDVTGLTIIAAAGETAEIQIGANVVGQPAVGGAGDVVFQFDITFALDVEGADLTIYTLPDAGRGAHVVTELDIVGRTANISSTVLAPGNYVACASDRGRAGTVVEFTVGTEALTVDLATLDLTLLGYPDAAELAGRTFTYETVVVNGRSTVEISQTAGGYDYQTSETARLFGDLWGVTAGDRKIFVDALLDGYNEFETARAAGNITVVEPFALNADGIVRIRLPIIRFVPVAGIATARGYEFFADVAEALAIDDAYAIFDTITLNALVGGTATADPPMGIQAATINASADSVVARVNAFSDGETDEVLDEIGTFNTQLRNIAANQIGG